MFSCSGAPSHPMAPDNHMYIRLVKEVQQNRSARSILEMSANWPFASLAKPRRLDHNRWDLKHELMVESKKGTANEDRKIQVGQGSAITVGGRASFRKWWSEQFIFYNPFLTTCWHPILSAGFCAQPISRELSPPGGLHLSGILSITHIKWQRIPKG